MPLGHSVEILGFYGQLSLTHHSDLSERTKQAEPLLDVEATYFVETSLVEWKVHVAIALLSKSVQKEVLIIMTPQPGIRHRNSTQPEYYVDLIPELFPLCEPILLFSNNVELKSPQNN